MSGQSDKRLMLEGLDKSGDIQGIADSYTTLPGRIEKEDVPFNKELRPVAEAQKSQHLWSSGGLSTRIGSATGGGQIVSCQLKSLRRV